MRGAPGGEDQAKPATEDLLEDDVSTSVLRQNFHEAMRKLSSESRQRLRELKETFEDCATVEKRIAVVKKAAGGG
jgi:hypothetical protein